MTDNYKTSEADREEPLPNTEKRYKSAFQQATVGLVVSGLDGRFMEVNRAFCQMTGYTSEELQSATFRLITSPEEQAHFQTQQEELLSRKTDSQVIQQRCVRKDGRQIWIRLQTTLNRDETGQAESLFTIVQDITADIALRDEQQKLLALVENSQSFMAIANLDGRLAYINQAGRKLVGLDADATAGRTVADFYTPEQFSFIRDVAVPTLLSQGSWSGRVHLRHFKTGELIPCHASGIRIDDPLTGKPIGRGFTMRDLRPELAAQEDQRKLLTLVDNSIELMSILELDGKNSYLNKAGMDMLGFENEQQVQDTPISDLHAPEHFSLVEQEVLPSVMNTGRWSGVMLVRHLKTGEIFPVFNNTIRIDDPESGNPVAVGAVMRDMRPELVSQQALVESEARFRSMIMQAPMAIGLLRGEKLVIESANELILNLWGKGTEIIGRELLDALPEIEGQGFVELLEGVYNSGQAQYGYEVLARLNRQGRIEECYFNFVYAPVREPNGSINSILVVATEVTQQVVARKQLEESEKRFRNLVLDAPMATAVYTGRDMVIQLANDTMLKVWGKDASIIGKTLREALPELEGQPFLQLLDDAYTTGVPYQASEDPVHLLVEGKLQRFYFNFTYKPLRDANNEVYAIMNMAVDVTNRVVANQQLKETEESLREAVDLAELATWTNNLVTGEMTYDDRVQDWLGVTEIITPEVIARCIHPDDTDQINQQMQAALSPQSGGRMDLEYRIISQQTGEERFMHTQARALFNDDGIPYLIRGTTQDITVQRMTEMALEKQVQLRTEELKKSNFQLQQSNQELERYAYVASHDLQEPLRKIQIYSGLLSERFQQEISPENRRYLDKIEESANRMSVLIKNILDFSRIGHKSQLALSVDLNEIVRAVLKDFELLLAQKNGRVEFQRLCVVDAVPLQMSQLFYNLIGNSLKFGREDVPPVITISCRELPMKEVQRFETLNQQRPHCEIIVSDNGIGFEPIFAEKIFGLFQRLHHRQKYEGTGIGLALCQRIVLNHQGEIWAESQEGQGATFHIILPIRKS